VILFYIVCTAIAFKFSRIDVVKKKVNNEYRMSKVAAIEYSFKLFY